VSSQDVTPDGAGTIDLEIEVEGTPEAVWEAIATGRGITAWLHPTEVEERTGGLFSFDLGPGLPSGTGTVTVWEPPRHFGQEVRWEPPADAAPARLATEWYVEAEAGGTCVVRMVMSGFGSGSGWEDELASMTDGMRQALESLRRHLAAAGPAGSTDDVASVFAAMPVTDLSVAVPWYVRVLGRPADAEPMPGLIEWDLVPNGALQLVLDPERAGGGLVTLQMSDLRGFADNLVERGVTGVEVDDTTSDKVLIINLTDPDGNAVTFVQPPDAPATTDGKVRP